MSKVAFCVVALLMSSPAFALEFFPSDQVKPGMKAEGHTVFVGHEIEKFPVTLLGLLKNRLGPGRDLVLARLEGPKTQFTGVVAGMSGSPIYVNGKLLGALAYAFGNFSKEPIAGITPIDGMLEALNLPYNPQYVADAGGKLELGKLADARVFALSDEPMEALSDMTGTHDTSMSAVSAAGDGLEPIATPLAVGGVSQSVLDLWGPMLQRRGMMVSGGAGGGDSQGNYGEPPPMRAGGMVAGALVSGDISVAAYGTVTYVNGNQLLAFGHPFLGIGVGHYPMAAAEVVNTLASEMRSFKQANVLGTKGLFTQDRLTAIGGHIGEVPPMIPVSLALDTAGVKQQNLSFELTDEPQLTPMLFAMSIATGLERRVAAHPAGTIRVPGSIQTDHGTVNLDDQFVGRRPERLNAGLAQYYGMLLNALWTNEIERVAVKKVDLKLTTVDDLERAQVMSLALDRAEARPGDTVTAVARVRPFRGPERYERFALKIPRHQPTGPVTVVVGGASAADLVVQGIEGSPAPRSADELVSTLNDRHRDGFLYLLAVQDRMDGLRIAGRVLPDVPPTVQALLASRQGDEAVRALDKQLLSKQTLKTSELIAGSAAARLEVVREGI